MKKSTQYSVSNFVSMKRIVLFSFLAMLVISSCRKADKMLQSSKPGLNQFASATPPSVANGRLVFSDQQHFDSWIEYLNTAIARDTAVDTDTISQDSTLHAIELNLGFTSLRQIKEQEFETLNQEGWATWEEIPLRHWICSGVEMSVLNAYEEVKIGNDIISYIDPTTQLIIKTEEAASIVRAFKANGYTDIHDIFLETGIVQSGVALNGVLQAGNLEVITLYGHGTTTNRAAQKTTNNDYIMHYGDVITEKGCQSAKVDLKGFYIADQSIPAKLLANYTVNWGDGTVQTYGAHQSFNASHTYSSVGLKVVVVTASYAGLTFSMSMHVTPNIVCKVIDVEKTTDYSPGPGWMLRGHVSAHGAKLQGFSESYKWNNSKGKWQKHGCENLYASLGQRGINKTSCTFQKDYFRKHSSYNASRIDLGTFYGLTNSEYVVAEHALYGTGNWYLFNAWFDQCSQ